VRPPLEAVLFDLDDTLHDDTATYRRAAERVAGEVANDYGSSAETLLAAYVRQSEAFWKDLDVAQFGTPLGAVRATLWGRALRASGLADDPALAVRCADAYNRYRREHLRLWPGALDLLVSLRARGYRLALVTNGFAETHREKLVVLELEDAFDEVFIADEVGMLKPDPRLFRLACERLGVEPAAAAMVGDRYERDIRGAHATGLFTVWLNLRDERVPAGAPEPDAIVERLEEVEGALPLTRKR
jgi:putative hydrolase of the HAD superfamily